QQLLGNIGALDDAVQAGQVVVPVFAQGIGEDFFGFFPGVQVDQRFGIGLDQRQFVVQFARGFLPHLLQVPQAVFTAAALGLFQFAFVTATFQIVQFVGA